MHEDFQRKGRRAAGDRDLITLGRLDGLDFANGILAGQHHQFASQRAGELHAGRAGDRELRGPVDREIGGDPSDESANADILNDGGIDTGGDDRAEVIFGVGELLGEYQGVEGDITAHATPMQELHQRGQVGLGEVLGPHAGVEAVETEVDRVGPVLHGRACAVPVSGGGQEFGQFQRREGSRFGHEADTVSGARAVGKRRRNRSRGPPSDRLLLCAEA